MSQEPGLHDPLFVRLKAGDEQAYVAIYNKYSKLLLQAAYNKIRNKIVVEDIVQNIFITIWEKREQLEVQDARHYLLGCLRFSVINYIRSQIVENKYISFSQTGPQTEADLFSKIEVDDLSNIIEEGIRSLPDKTQEIFRLSRFEHQSAKKISFALNISEKTVEYHITRSLKLIRAYLKNYYPLIFMFLYL